MEFPFLPFAVFAIAGALTPGPNNLMVAAAAANSGLRAVMPHILGITAGFAAMILLVGLGLAVPFAAFPVLHTAMRWFGAAWILVIAWQIASAPAGEGAPARPPLRFTGAAMFQWINPKAWLLALGMASTWTNPDAPLAPQFAMMALVFAMITLPSCLFWAALGEQASRLLKAPLALRIFNVAMAALLVLSMLPVLRGE